MYKLVSALFFAIAIAVLLFMVSDVFKDLDRVHRIYLAVTLAGSVCAALFMETIGTYLAVKQKYRGWLGSDPVERRALKEDRTEYLAIHRELDRLEVPREIDGQLLTLWGRMSIWRNEKTPTEETLVGHLCSEYDCVSMCLDKAQIPDTQDGSPLSLWGRIENYKATRKETEDEHG